MVIVFNLSDKVAENSVFGVWKEFHVSQRLIWGGNRSKFLLKPEKSSVQLPSHDVLCSLRLLSGQQLYISGCDISQYHNRLRAPSFLIYFLGLPCVRASDLGISSGVEFVVPCLTCIPMGAFDR